MIDLPSFTSIQTGYQSFFFSEFQLHSISIQCYTVLLMIVDLPLLREMNLGIRSFYSLTKCTIDSIAYEC